MFFGRAVFLRQFFRLPHVQSARDNRLRQSFRIFRRQQSAGVTACQLARFQHFFDGLRQSQQTHCVGDVTAAFADGLRQFFLRIGKLLHQAAIALGFLQSVQVLPLQVFDKSDFHRFFVGKILNQNGNFAQACLLRRAPTPFTADDFVFSRFAHAHDKRLNYSFCFDGFDQIAQSVRIKRVARLKRAWLQIGNSNGFNPALNGVLFGFVFFTQQRA